MLWIVSATWTYDRGVDGAEAEWSCACDSRWLRVVVPFVRLVWRTSKRFLARIGFARSCRGVILPCGEVAYAAEYCVTTQHPMVS